MSSHNNQVPTPNKLIQECSKNGSNRKKNNQK